MADLFQINCPKCNHSAHMHKGGICNAKWKNKTVPTKFHSCKCELSSDDVLLTIIEKDHLKLAKIEELLKMAIEQTQADERLNNLVTIEENAPLALIQVQLEAQLRTLRFLLKKFKDEGSL